MTYLLRSLALPLFIGLAACGSSEGQRDPGGSDLPAETDAGAEGRLDRPDLATGEITVEGRIEAGVECPILRTPDGDTWALALGEEAFGPGDYVRITGDRAEMSMCQQGRGTIEPNRIDSIAPPARDRDPSRAGGQKLSASYLTGVWVAKGVSADCDNPDFFIRRTSGGLVMEADIADHDDNALVILGDYPRLDLDEPMPDLPMESRGPDGVAILRPATDAAYDPVKIGSATITGDGVVFIKCSG
ncbi:DUF5818 domain-containing protein [Erythrobacter sp. SD-21]|uniref:DUF5818 domain-containing protein n=1 Tax=Erythrobacter sp. SD-21 TaxID=161528 RepID=UPI0012EAD1A0|nr:DUF5818 domain-containing protein [Erythrobacter sp. SD-21]